jgi:site-specific DNA recombinase
VRAILANPTYKGLHIYGKRSKRKRELIERKVPATVPEDQWDRVQVNLRNHQLEAMKNSKRQYLLRGLIKCGQCGLTYIGTAYYGKRSGDKRKITPYYRCNGKQSYRGQLLGGCSSKNLPAEWLENIIWTDCVNFILNPSDAIKELAANMEERFNQRESLENQRQLLLKASQEKDSEKQRILDLFRKNVIDFKDVEAQLQKITIEKENLKLQIRELDAAIDVEELATNQANSVEELLNQFRELIEGDDISFEEKRKIVRCLVKEIKVNTNLDDSDRPEATISITYCFAKDVSRTGRGSSPPPA